MSAVIVRHCSFATRSHSFNICFRLLPSATLAPLNGLRSVQPHPPVLVLCRHFAKKPVSSADLKAKVLENPIDSAINKLQKNLEVAPSKVTQTTITDLLDKPDITPQQAVRLYEMVVKHRIDNDDVRLALVYALQKQKNNESQITQAWQIMYKQGQLPTFDILRRLFELCIERQILEAPFQIIQLMYNHKESIRYQNMPQKWGVLVDLVSSKQGLQKSLEVMDRMIALGHTNTETSSPYAQIMRHIAKNGTIKEAEQLYERIQKEAVPTNHFIFNHLMDAYARAGDQEKAWHFFRASRRVTVHPYVSFLQWLGKWGHTDKCFEVYKMMQDDLYTIGVTPGTSTINAMVEACGINNQLNRTIILLDDLKKWHKKPATETFALLYDYILKSKDKELLPQVWSRMKGFGMKPDSAMNERIQRFARENNVTLLSIEKEK